MRKVIHTEQAPRAVGPYSQAVQAGGVLYVSGQIPLDPGTGKLVEGDIAAQTHRVMRSLRAILQAAGSDLGQVVKATVYLVDLKDFEAMNRVYAEYFETFPPARVCVEVAALPRGASVEIDAIAVVS